MTLKPCTSDREAENGCSLDEKNQYPKNANASAGTKPAPMILSTMFILAAQLKQRAKLGADLIAPLVTIGEEYIQSQSILPQGSIY